MTTLHGSDQACYAAGFDGLLGAFATLTLRRPLSVQVKLGMLQTEAADKELPEMLMGVER